MFLKLGRVAIIMQLTNSLIVYFVILF